MVIPKKIRIGGQDINIVHKERLDNDILGEICLAEGVIRIADTLSNRTSFSRQSKRLMQNKKN